MALMLAGLVAACSSVGQFAGRPPDEPAAPAAQAGGSYGSGGRVVGILAFEEPGNLADGAPNSTHLAAQLAAASIAGNPVTVVVRTVLPDGSNVGTLINELDAVGATIVIGSNNEAAAAAVAKAMQLRDVPTISLTSFADLAIQLYGAAYVPNEEAVSLVNEAARRGYSSLAVVSTGGRESEAFTKAVLGLAGAAGISARPVDGSTDSQFAAAMGGMAAAGVAVDAIVFASGPVRAGGMVASLRLDPRFKDVKIVGNSGWGMIGKPPADLKGGWYPTTESKQRPEFIEKFRAAHGATATLNAMMVYDLVVLAAALPQAVAEDPYHPEVLTNPQGFVGFSGQFRFAATGMLSARSYVISTVK